MTNFIAEVTGKVIDGEKRGKELGFPTANIQISDGEAPKSGVYAGLVEYKGDKYIGAIAYGHNPSFKNAFGAYYLKLEVHILDFNQEIYGEELTVKFHTKLRNEEKFDDIKDLVAQIEKDCVETRQIISPML